MLRTRISNFVVTAAACLLAFGCEQKGQQQSPAGTAARQTTTDHVVTLKNKPLAASQKELLELAYASGSAIPVEADLKDRSKAQENVVEGCLTLHQAAKAHGYIEGIKDWRRGAAYADLAMYCARNEQVDQVQKFLDLAEKIAAGEGDWQRDRIRVKIAQVHMMLGQAELAAKFEAGVEASETGKVAGVSTSRPDDESFNEQMKVIEAGLASEKFDIRRNAIDAAAKVFGHFYADKAKRSLAAGKIKASWGEMPLFLRINVLLGMAESALDHADQAEALVLVNEAQAIKDGADWPVDYHIPLIARLAGLRFRAGDKEKARIDLGASLTLFDAEKDKLLTTEWAGTLRSIAESYQAMGDAGESLKIYKRAVAEGASNPNGRPRALDLSATCLSMAVYGVEPDAELWARIREVHQELHAPW